MNKLIIGGIWIAAILLLVNCKKEAHLTDSPEFYIGTWEWKYTYVHDPETGYVIDSVFPNSTEADFTATIEVTPKGTVKLYKNDELFLKIKRSQMSYSYQESQGSARYSTPSELFESNSYNFYLYISTFINLDKTYVAGFPLGGGARNCSSVQILGQNSPFFDYRYNIFEKVK